MAIFEKRLIERKVVVFRIEANNEEQAEELWQLAAPQVIHDSWPIDAEEGQPWAKVED